MITDAINLIFEEDAVISGQNYYASLESTIGSINIDDSISMAESLIRFSAETLYNSYILTESSDSLLESTDDKSNFRKRISKFWNALKAFITKVIKGIKEQAIRFMSFIKRFGSFTKSMIILNKIEKIYKKNSNNKEIDDIIFANDFEQTNILTDIGTKRIREYSLNCKLDEVLNKYLPYVKSSKYTMDDKVKGELDYDDIVHDIMDILEVDKLVNRFIDDNEDFKSKLEKDKYLTMFNTFSVKKINRKCDMDTAIDYLAKANNTLDFLEKEGLKYFNSYIKQLEKWIKYLDNIEKESSRDYNGSFNEYNMDNLNIFRVALSSSINICNNYTRYIIKLSSGIVSENKRFYKYAKAKLNKIKEVLKKSGKDKDAKEVEEVIEDINDIAEETSKEN